MILSLSDDQLAEFIDRKRARRRLTCLVHMLNELSAGQGDDLELALSALRRMGLEPAG